MSSFFGQNNNNQPQQSGFGGFGANNNNTASGFGQPQNTGFGGGGTNTAGGGLFGNSGSGFGSAGTGFGTNSNTSNPFGSNRPAFGNNTASSGSMFGNTTATAGSSSGFSGFGATNTNNSSGGLFGGASKPAFGSANTSGGSIFGGGSGGNAFGSSNNQPTTGFGGAPISSALGGNLAECQGTGSTPFQAYSEKESGNNTTNHFQSISFMQPYKNYSFEELRLADYNQGRRYGNGNGQAGAFGANTGFGGFGQQTNSGPFGASASTGSGLFGAQPTTTASAFGATQTASSSFGGTTGGGLFGPKPAGTGLFGATSTAPAQSGGGLFGAQSGFGGTTAGTGTGSGFGGGSGTTGGGLFGSNNQQNQKSGFFGGTGTGTGFGASGTTGGGLFGSGQVTSGFGGGQQQQQQAPASNPFGTFGNQPQNQTGTGSAFSGFGTANQPAQKPGGLFGNPPANTVTTGGGLFGNNQANNQQQPASAGLFGTGTNQSGGSSLFGPKPAAASNAFGSAPSNLSNNAGGGLFGSAPFNNNSQPQQNQAVGLFATLDQQQQQQQPKPGGLFGNTGSGIGGGLFSNNNPQPSGGSLFGNSGATNQQQSSSLFGGNNNSGTSIFGGTTPQPNALQPPQPQYTSALPGRDDPSPYGSTSIFSGLPAPPQLNAGPIATPISAAQKQKKSAVLPQYKINPNQASRLVTPQKRGYGFTYSTYGTPSSISSNASTPGNLNTSLLYSSIGRGLGKSLSTSNLRRSFDTEGDSLLSPGAFSANSSRFSGSGSVKKFAIDRSLRTDLFGSQGLAAISSPEKLDQSKQQGILKKKVSFDASAVGGNGYGNHYENPENNVTNGFLTEDEPNEATPSAQEQGFLRSSSRGNLRPTGAKPNGAASHLDIEQVKGNELAIVHEDDSPETDTVITHQPVVQVPQSDPQPKAYWMKPSLEALRQLSRDQLKSIPNFSVGREACGHVEFNEPVDLTLTPLDDIYKKIVLIELRSLTVYPDSNVKPPRGKGMNVPSTIFLENSWPRQKDRKTPSHEKSGPRFNKHVDRLRKVTGTGFVRYEKDTGTWVFTVPHFTTYALDYDDTGSEGDSLHTSTVSAAPDTPTPKSRAPRNAYTPITRASALDSPTLSDAPSLTGSSPDDTFEFRKKKNLPGAFDNSAVFEDHPMEEADNPDGSFLDQSPGASPSESGDDEPSEMQDQDVEIEDRSLLIQDDGIEMAGSFPQGDYEDADSSMTGDFAAPISTLKNSDRNLYEYGTPTELTFNPGGDWAQELQRTISPRKQDRQALRENQKNALEDPILDRDITPKAVSKSNGSGQPIATSIDLMNSLLGKEQARRSGRRDQKGGKSKGFQWPYNKQPKSYDNHDDMNEMDRRYHKSYKPHWGPANTFLYAMPSKFNLSQSKSTQTRGLMQDQKGVFVSESRDIRFAKFTAPSPLIPNSIVHQRTHTKVAIVCGVPHAKAQFIPFHDIALSVRDDNDHEMSVWELAAILFDEQKLNFATNDSSLDPRAFEHRIRKDLLIELWDRLCQAQAMKDVAAASNSEERAIAHLSAHNIVEACDELIKGKDFRLATLIAQIGGDRAMHEDIAKQINEWRDLNVLSEMTEPIRTLYELLSGNACYCEGKKGPIEDKAKSFVISEQFNLDWKRTFGLRLWYAIMAEEPIQAAVGKYLEDLGAHETKKPLPLFLEESEHSIWKDEGSASREDVLWGLLKLYASSKGTLPEISIAGIVMPHNVTGNPLDARLSFQLYHALSLRFPTSDLSKADQLACDYAMQLESAGEWLWAIFIVLHISDDKKRQQIIQTKLAYHANDIADPDSDVFKTLTDEFKLPPSWIWEAKALHARSVTQDHVREVQCLIHAENWDEAHQTLCRIVGPQAVIAQDYATLKQLLESFAKGKIHIGEWTLGGQVYEDFLVLIQGDSEGQQKINVLRRLLSALPAMVQELAGKLSLQEKVAIREMSAIVGKEVAKSGSEKGLESWRILQLPLAADGHLAHTLQMSMQYYSAVMAHGRV